MSKWIGFTIIALLLGGCVKFERQTMVYRHDTERDELRMLMIYEGIYGSGREERDRKELLSVLLRPRTFFFSNWLLEYDRDQWIELADDLAEDENPEISELGQRMSRLVLDNVRVDNGTFYFNHENKLSAYQLVTIASVSALIAVLNEFTNVLLIHGEVKPAELSLVSSEFTENMIRDAVYAGHDWLTLDQGELRVRVPLAAVDYEELRQDLDEDDEWLEFTRAGMRTTFGGGVVEFGVGSPLPSGSAFSVRVAEGPYEPNLVPIVEAENLLRPDPDLESIAAWFDRPAWAVVVVVTGLVVVAASALLHTTERNQPVP